MVEGSSTTVGWEAKKIEERIDKVSTVWICCGINTGRVVSLSRDGYGQSWVDLVQGQRHKGAFLVKVLCIFNVLSLFSAG